MKTFLLLLPLGLVALVSCKSKPKVASANPYQNNPYYGSSSSTTDYSSSTAAASYPSYTENTYTPPTSVPGPSGVPSVPSVPTYNQPTYSGPATSPAPSGPAPVSYAGSGSKAHTVTSGENLYRISLKHGTTVAAIKSANGLSGDTIKVGQKLVIP